MLREVLFYPFPAVGTNGRYVPLNNGWKHDAVI